MGEIDAATLAERTAAVDRHLRRVAERLPAESDDLRPMDDATDAVILHLWQAIQVVIDLAVSACVARGLGTPPTYADAFRMLAHDDVLSTDLADRLARAAGFRNLVVNAYAELDLQRVHAAATSGPADLRAFLAAMRAAVDSEPSDLEGQA
jgi:uncharacterized protein YutE (UPF0331/DUF86 family)